MGGPAPRPRSIRGSAARARPRRRGRRLAPSWTLGRLAAAYLPKCDRVFVFEARDGELHAEGSADPALAFEVRATKAFGFEKGASFSQTRYRFEPQRFGRPRSAHVGGH